MSKDNIEKMRKLIEEKKKKSSQQGYNEDAKNKKAGNFQKAFKNTKRGGAIDK